MPASISKFIIESPVTGTHKSRNLVVLFDGACSLCNYSILYILRHDRRKVFVFASLHSDFGRNFQAGERISGSFPDSLILYENGKIFFRSAAIIRIAELLRGIYKMAVVFRIFPKNILDALYNYIARHRFRWFGIRKNCMVAGSEFSERFLL